MAANQLSPGVVIQERDLTTITTLSTANVGVIAAPFELGPVEEIIEISNERQLAERFGNPNDANYEYWYLLHNSFPTAVSSKLSVLMQQH